MTLDLYFKLSSYVMLALSFLMLVLAGRVDGWTSSGFVLVILLSAIIDLRLIKRWHWWRERRWVNWLWMLYLPLLAFDQQILNTPAPLVLIRFILVTVSLRLLREKRERDWLLLYCVSFLQVLLAAGMMMDTVFVVLLLAYLLAAISTLCSFEIRRAQLEIITEPQPPLATNTTSALELPNFWRLRRQQARQSLSPPRWWRIFGFSLVALMAILLLATPLFLALPRLQRPFSTGAWGNEALSGFSESVQLGEVGRIKLNPQVVMRVSIKWPTGMTPQALRWRGMVLNYYDRGTWTRYDDTSQSVRYSGGGFLVSEQHGNEQYTEQRFFLEPMNTGILFAAPRAVWVTGVEQLSRSDNGVLETIHQQYNRFRYQVVSDVSVPTPAALRLDNERKYPEKITRQNLQLPLHFSERVRNLAWQIIGQNDNTYDSVTRALDYLQDHYQYTLDLTRQTKGDPIDDFLFNTKAGHCEYFATALAILLRARGIPARIVNGFQMGEFSEAGNFYTVRQSDAHSWTEVYFPQHGWVAFDPTPPAGLNDYASGSAWMRQYGDMMQLFWQERVVGFDSGEQLALLFGAQRKVTRWRAQIERQWSGWSMQFKGWFGDNNPGEQWPPPINDPNNAASTNGHKLLAWLLSLRSLFVLAVLGMLSLVGYRYGWRQRWQRDAAASAIAFYQQMLRALARAGYKRQPHQTPREFAAQVNLPSVHELTKIYQQARFSAQPLTTAEALRVNELLREIKQLQRNR